MPWLLWMLAGGMAAAADEGAVAGLHVAVAVTGEGPEAARCRVDLRDLLGAAGYVLRPAGQEDPFARCGEDATCWNALPAAWGVDLVVAIDPAGRFALALDGHPDAFLLRQVVLPRGGGVPLDEVEAHLLAPARVRIDSPGAVEIRWDGEALEPVEGVAVLDGVAPGRHALRVLGAGGTERVRRVLVPAGGETVVVIPPPEVPPPVRRRRGRWGVYAIPVVFAGGVAALVAASSLPGDAALTGAP